MTFDEFITKWTGKPVDFDGVYPNQCMDLMHQYVYEVLGLTDRKLLAHPAAYQVFTDFTATEHFEKIANTPDGIPQKGDIVLFNKTPSNPYGHVCIFIEGDSKRFKSFDANFPLNSLPHVQEHSYGFCLGWLRPKNSKPDQQATIDQLRTERDTNWNMFVRLCEALGTQHNVEVAVAEINKLSKVEDTLMASESKVAGQKTKIEELEERVKELQTTNKDLQSQTQKLSEDLKDKEKELLEQGINITELSKEVGELKQSAKLPLLTGWKLKIMKFLAEI